MNMAAADASPASGGQRRAQRVKIDSNEVLRQFRLRGWKPQASLDAGSVDQSVLDAVAASMRQRDAVAKHAQQLCEFVFANLELATVSMVDVFSADLWGTIIDPDWAKELMTLTDEEVALLSEGLLERAWRSPSLASFVRTAKTLDLPRECSIPQAAIDVHRFPLVAMTEKKAHEVRVLAHVAAHLAHQQSIKVHFIILAVLQNCKRLDHTMF